MKLFLIVAAAILLFLLVALVVLRFLYHRRLAHASRYMQVESDGAVFSEALLEDLPEPAKRYFRHSISPGAPLFRSVRVEFERGVKTKKTDESSPFHRFDIAETITPGKGSVATGHLIDATVPTAVSYWYAEGQGGLREALWGLVPIVLGRGDVAARVNRSRIMNDYILLPSALLPQRGAEWEDLGSEDRARVTVYLDGESLALDLQIDEAGGLREVTAQRWGSVGVPGRKFQHIPFGFLVDEEGTFEGYTIPTRARSGWWYGTDRYIESIHLDVKNVSFK